MTLLALFGLALADGAFAGLRAVAGRTGRVRRGRLYLRAMATGAALTAALFGALVALGFAIFGVPQGSLRAALDDAGVASLRIGLPYAGIVALAYALRLAPSIDVVTLTSVLAFGPLTLLRPVLLVAAAIAAIAASPRPEVVGVVLASLAAALSMPRALDAVFDRPEGLDR